MSCWSKESGDDDEDEEEEEEESEAAGNAASTFLGFVLDGKWARIHWRMWAWGMASWASAETPGP